MRRDDGRRLCLSTTPFSLLYLGTGQQQQFVITETNDCYDDDDLFFFITCSPSATATTTVKTPFLKTTTHRQTHLNGCDALSGRGSSTAVKRRDALRKMGKNRANERKREQYYYIQPHTHPIFLMCGGNCQAKR